MHALPLRAQALYPWVRLEWKGKKLNNNGEITSIEGTRVMGLIDSYRRILELTEIEERLRALENAGAVS